MPTYDDLSCWRNPDARWDPYAEPAPDLGPEACPYKPATMFGGEIGGGLSGPLRQALSMYTEPSPADEARAELKQQQDAQAEADRLERLQAQADAHKEVAAVDRCINGQERRAAVFCSDEAGPRLPNGSLASSYEECKTEWRDGVVDKSVTAGGEENIAVNGSLGADAFGTFHAGGSVTKSYTKSGSEEKSLHGFEGYDQQCMEKGGAK